MSQPPVSIRDALALFFLFLNSLMPITTSNTSPPKWEKWCGKHYQPGSPVELPGGKFELWANWTIRCTPVLQPYLESEPIFLVVDLATQKYTQLDVLDTETGRVLFSGVAQSNAKIGPLEVGSARVEPYRISCRAPIGSHSFQLSHLPRGPTRIAQLDADSGFFRVYDEKGLSRPFFPFGFYTSFGGYMDSPELSTIIADMKDRKVNTVHLVPGGTSPEDLVAAATVFKSLEEAGLWFQYDMRHSYKNLTQVDEQVKLIAHQQNLLSYYTADEPDGPGDPLDAPELTRNYLRNVDPYHPVALALNCEDFHFTEYTAGTEIVMADIYSIALKSTSFSGHWGTVCNTTYGCCGCDNCEGNFQDITRRMRLYRSRRSKLGRTRSMQIWGVPQAFKDDSFWTRQPTYAEFLLSCSVFVIEGAVGLMGWLENHDMGPELKRATKVFGTALEKVTPYLALSSLDLDPPISLDNQDTLLTRLWTDPETGFTLIIIANIISTDQPWSIHVPNFDQSFKALVIEEVFSSNVVKNPNIGLTSAIEGEIGGLGCGAFILQF